MEVVASNPQPTLTSLSSLLFVGLGDFDVSQKGQMHQPLTEHMDR